LPIFRPTRKTCGEALGPRPFLLVRGLFLEEVEHRSCRVGAGRNALALRGGHDGEPGILTERGGPAGKNGGFALRALPSSCRRLLQTAFASSAARGAVA